MKPLLFDTSTVWSASSLVRLRKKYPDRVFLMPSIVIAERVNRLRREHGETYDSDLVHQFLSSEHLALKPVVFDHAAAEVLAEIAFRLGKAWYPEWPLVKRNVKEQPCGERCRWADHAITALAIIHNALLVTNDSAILTACQSDTTSFFPEACQLSDL